MSLITLISLILTPYSVGAGEAHQERSIENFNEKIMEQLSSLTQQKIALTENQKKIDIKIFKVVQEVEKSLEKGITPQFQAFSSSVTKIDNLGSISVELRVDSLTPEQQQLLVMAGMTVDAAFPEYGLVKGTIPFNMVEAVSKLDFVKCISNPGIMLHNTGNITSEGDSVLQAAIARDLYGYDGTGIKVGVISDGVSNLADSVASGDLPSSPAIDVRKAGSGDEGTAMLEIIHDLAPGAALAFYGPEDSTDMVTAINTLASAGCNIIVDDLIFGNEPKFEDGPIAQASRNFYINGGLYVTSAGNSAQRHYYHQYIPLDTGGSTYPYIHNYGNSDIDNDFTVPAGNSIMALLQWNNPWGKSGDDFSFALFDEENLLAFSDQIQDGSGNPFEYLTYTNNTVSDKTVYLTIWEYDTTSAQSTIVFDYHVWYGSGLQYYIPENSIIGHEAVAEVLSCAAASATNPDNIEGFSSQGPGTIYFPSFEQRQLPNITGVDGVHTKTGEKGHFVDPFYGTSASAPHIAAIGALVWSADLTQTSTEVFNLIKSTATDKGAAGWDAIWGMGLANASTAVDNVNTPPTVTTLAVSNIATTSAILNGQLTSLGTENPVRVSFFWGTTPGSWSETSVVERKTTGAFSANITIVPGTTYYFRAKTTGDGTSLGTQLNFVSIPVPQMADIEEPEDAWYTKSPGFANLAFSDLNGLDGGYYQLDAYNSGNWTALFTSCNTTSWSSDNWSLPQLEFGSLDEGEHTLYFRATNDDGEEEGESGEWAWVFFKDTVNPDSVDDLVSPTHTDNWSTSNRITVNWTAATDNGSGIAGYAVLWNTDNLTVPAAVKNTDNVSTLTSPVLASGSHYYFHIKAVDRAGNWGPVSHAGPFAIDATAPVGLGNLASTSHQTGVWSDNDTIMVTWTAAADGDSGLAGYAVCWDTTADTNPPSTVNTSNLVTENITVIADGAGYYFHVKARDNAGNWSSPLHLGPFHISVQSPVLDFGAVSPASGYQNGKYIYSVNYRHPQGLPPTMINVVIDGTASDNMTWTTGQSGNFTTNQVFIYEVQGSSLAVGNHTFSFTATDNASHIAVGDINTHSGPAISAQAVGGFGGGGGGVGGGGGAPVGAGITNLAIYTNNDGLFNMPGEARSEDGKVLLQFSKGVLSQTKDSTQLKYVKIVPVDSPADAPAGSQFIGKVYEMTPEGATFAPAVTMTIFYESGNLPAGIDTNSLAIVLYNPETRSWMPLQSVVNKTANSVTTGVEHFSIYAVLGKKAVIPVITQAALTPAKFSLSGITVNPVTAMPGESVTVSARVSNTGETDGDYEVILKVNGMVESTRTISVKAGSSDTVTFTVSRDNPGDCEVEINGAKAVFTVQAAPQTTATPTEPDVKRGGRGPNWLLIGLLAFGGLALGVGVVMFINRGRK